MTDRFIAERDYTAQPEDLFAATDEDRSMLSAGWTNALLQLTRAFVRAGVS